MTALVAGWSGDDDTSGLALAGPVPLLVLVLARRHPGELALPLFVGQVVGGVLGGLGALALDGPLGGALVDASPDRVAVGVVALVVGLVAAWLVLAVDGGEPAAWLAATPVVGGAGLGAAGAGLVQPAVAVGLGVAGLVAWTPALVAAGAVLVGAAAGTYATAAVSRG
ncbi:MAG: hypothetical protein PGN07_11360 [Aeromicrobium erythreum]